MMPVAEQLKRVFSSVLMVAAIGLLISCKSSGSGSVDILGPSDETADAAAIIMDANADLKAIKVIYKDNENKREDLKKAMAADNAEEVKKIADSVVDIINDGAAKGVSALKKIDQARDMNINPDYAEYLRLKSDALQKQLDAFEQYRQAARNLRNSYDPKNTQMRDKVKADFKDRSENFRQLMDKARDFSLEANQVAKEALAKSSDAQ